MAVSFRTTTPKKLLSAYKKAIDDGHVMTWSYDADGDFTHTADRWASKAWFRPKINEGVGLIFNIIAPFETDLDTSVYAVYHGRLIESMLRHCDSLFIESAASALPEAGDAVNSDE